VGTNLISSLDLSVSLTNFNFLQVDTYTKGELKRCSLFCLTNFRRLKEIFVGLQDRAMLLLSTTTKFFGASCCAVELSNLFPAIIPLLDSNELGIKVKSILFVSRWIFDLFVLLGTWCPLGQCQTQSDQPHRRTCGHSSSPHQTLSNQWGCYASLGNI
jgi:hypothetical protein